MEDIKVVSPSANTQPDLWPIAAVRTGGVSDHTLFYFIQLHKKCPGPGSMVVAVDTEKSKTKLPPCVCMWGVCIYIHSYTQLTVLG